MSGQFYTIKDAMKRYGRDRRTISRWLNDPHNTMPHCRITGRVYFTLKNFADWESRQTVQ